MSQSGALRKALSHDSNPATDPEGMIETAKMVPRISSRGKVRFKVPEKAGHSELRFYAKLVERTVDVFGDEVKASLWLSSPNVDLGGKTPLELAQTTGYDPKFTQEHFEPIFSRIEHGIYY